MEFLNLLAKIRTPFFDNIFLLLTGLGGEMTFIAIAVITFWCFSKRDGYLLLSIGFFGTIVNQFLKISFRILRPWDISPSFQAVAEAIPDASGFSFPSGHTQNAVGTFGTIFAITKKRWLQAISVAICLIVPFSRMYLGVHTPLDVLFSFFFAILVILTVKPIFYRAYSKKYGMYAFIGVMGIISLLYLIYVQFVFDRSVLSSDQMHNYISALKNAYLIFGALIGVLIAYFIESKYVKFETSGKWYTQIFKAIVGLFIVVGLLEGLKLPINLILDENTIGRAVRYAIVVIFAIAIYPMSFKLFKKLEERIESKKQKIGH